MQFLKNNYILHRPEPMIFSSLRIQKYRLYSVDRYWHYFFFFLYNISTMLSARESLHEKVSTSPPVGDPWMYIIMVRSICTCRPKSWTMRRGGPDNSILIQYLRFSSPHGWHHARGDRPQSITAAWHSGPGFGGESSSGPPGRPSENFGSGVFGCLPLSTGFSNCFY